MTTTSPDTLESWMHALRAMRLVEALLDRDIHDAELQMTEYEVLAALAASESGWLRMSVLADAVVQSRSRLTHTAIRLEKRGWVKRRPSKDDRRGIELSLSADGRQRFEGVQERLRQRVAELVHRHIDHEDVLATQRVAEAVIVANEPLIGPRGI